MATKHARVEASSSIWNSTTRRFIFFASCLYFCIFVVSAQQNSGYYDSMGVIEKRDCLCNRLESRNLNCRCKNFGDDNVDPSCRCTRAISSNCGCSNNNNQYQTTCRPTCEQACTRSCTNQLQSMNRCQSTCQFTCQNTCARFSSYYQPQQQQQTGAPHIFISGNSNQYSPGNCQCAQSDSSCPCQCVPRCQNTCQLNCQASGQPMQRCDSTCQQTCQNTCLANTVFAPQNSESHATAPPPAASPSCASSCPQTCQMVCNQISTTVPQCQQQCVSMCNQGCQLGYEPATTPAPIATTPAPRQCVPMCQPACLKSCTSLFTQDSNSNCPQACMPTCSPQCVNQASTGQQQQVQSVNEYNQQPQQHVLLPVSPVLLPATPVLVPVSPYETNLLTSYNSISSQPQYVQQQPNNQPTSSNQCNPACMPACSPSCVQSQTQQNQSPQGIEVSIDIGPAPQSQQQQQPQQQQQCTPQCMPTCTITCLQQINTTPTPAQQQCLPQCMPSCQPQCVQQQQQQQPQQQQCIPQCMPKCEPVCIQQTAPPAPVYQPTQAPALASCPQQCQPTCQPSCVSSAVQALSSHPELVLVEQQPLSLPTQAVQCHPLCMPHCQPECLMAQMPNYLQASYSAQAKSILQPSTFLAGPYGAVGTGHLSENSQPTKFSMVNNKQENIVKSSFEGNNIELENIGSYESDPRQPSTYIVTFDGQSNEPTKVEELPQKGYKNSNFVAPHILPPAPTLNNSNPNLLPSILETPRSSNFNGNNNQQPQTQILPMTIYQQIKSQQQQQQQQQNGPKQCINACMPLCLPECVNAGIEDSRFRSYELSEIRNQSISFVTNRPTYEVSSNKTFPPMKVITQKPLGVTPTTPLPTLINSYRYMSTQGFLPNIIVHSPSTTTPRPPQLIQTTLLTPRTVEKKKLHSQVDKEAASPIWQVKQRWALRFDPDMDMENFVWKDYLNQCNAEMAPVELFDEVPDSSVMDHFKAGTKLESTDLCEPHLICPATVVCTKGRLVRVHFDGWEDNYDQLFDYRSHEIFPVGWCEIYGYNLEHPKVDEPVKKKKKK
uniref:Uncharacterized protein n=1 Tax=Acrobeloides nanus TaxID=290746 RepID=A0A914E748_9BILA